jgi:hypothetical protein
MVALLVVVVVVVEVPMEGSQVLMDRQTWEGMEVIMLPV